MAGQVDFLSLCVGLWLSQRTLFALLSLLCTEHEHRAEASLAS